MLSVDDVSGQVWQTSLKWVHSMSLTVSDERFMQHPQYDTRDDTDPRHSAPVKGDLETAAPDLEN
jgi:hypothetical protein